MSEETSKQTEVASTELETANKTKSKTQHDTNVMRISTSNFKRLKALKDHRKQTYDAILEVVIDIAERMQDKQCLYIVDTRIYDSLADARGAAIQESVRRKKPPEWPTIVVVVGKDELYDPK